LEGQITRIEILSPQFDDEDLSKIARIRSLKSITLSGSGVTDKGLAHLQGHRNLRQFLVRPGNPAITNAGLKMLDKELANCQVARISVSEYVPRPR
jgi:hypothetical protein